MRIGNRQWFALASIASVTAIVAGCSTGDPTGDQYAPTTTTATTTPTTTSTTTPTTTTPTTTQTTTSATTTTPTTTSGTTTSGTTTSGRRKPPKTKIKVRAKVAQRQCRNDRRNRGKKCARPERRQAGGVNRRGTPNIRVRNRRARVEFEAEPSEPGTTFECRVDDGEWETCSSPFVSEELSKGKHTVYVRAVAADGEVDPTPARDRQRIKKGPR